MLIPKKKHFWNLYFHNGSDVAIKNGLNWFLVDDAEILPLNLLEDKYRQSWEFRNFISKRKSPEYSKKSYVG